MKRSACLGRISTTPLIVLAAVALAVGLWAGSRWMPHSVSQSDLQAAVLYPAPAPVPPFTLQRPDGSNLTEADLQGHWSVLFFGFTHCPDICPTSLAEFKQ
ncbi:MAG TPA: SCO family protein, partial [Dokdonella sp.]|nr:SCO family protein [Dokdonella sp.]